MKQNSEIDANDNGFVMEAAEHVLQHLLHHMVSYPSFDDPMIINTTLTNEYIPETMEKNAGDATVEKILNQKHVIFSRNRKSLISYAHDGNNNISPRIYCRDLVGKFSWEIVPETVPKNPPARYTISERATSGLQFDIIKERTKVISLVTDNISSILRNIGASYPDCLLDKTPLDEPVEISGDRKSEIDEMERRVDNIVRQEQIYNELYSSKSSNIESLGNYQDLFSDIDSLRTELEGMKFQKAVQCNDRLANSSPFDQCRMFLNQMGHFQSSDYLDSPHSPYFDILDHHSSGLWRDIRELDKRPGRECIKIAVIYIGLGQEDEKTILQNDARTSDIKQDYKDFVNSLGWSVNKIITFR